MFGIGFLELVFIAVAVLLVVGPKKLPDVMKQAGRFFVQIRRTANDVRSTFDSVIREAEDEIRKEEVAALRALTSKPTTAPTASSTSSSSTAVAEGTTIIQPTPYDPAFNPKYDAPHEPHSDPGHNPDGTLITKHDDGHKSEPTNG